MYYLQSRYYDPAIGRFINADSYTSTNAKSFLSNNTFAYCENDPINRADNNGGFFHIVVGAIIGGTSAYLGSLICGADPKEAFHDALWGAASGALSAALPGAGAAIDVVLSVAQSVIEDVSSNEPANTVVLDAFASAMLSVFPGVADDFITTKQATKELKSALKAIPKLTRGNSPNVKKAAKKIVKGYAKRSSKSFFSKMAWNTGATGAKKWVTTAIQTAK